MSSEIADVLGCSMLVAGRRRWKDVDHAEAVSEGVLGRRY